MGQCALPRSSTSGGVFSEQELSTVFQSAYSPDPNLYDAFLFQWLKSDLRKRDFKDKDDVEWSTLQWPRKLGGNHFQREVQRLVDHCQAVIAAQREHTTD